MNSVADMDTQAAFIMAKLIISVFSAIKNPNIWLTGRLTWTFAGFLKISGRLKWAVDLSGRFV